MGNQNTAVAENKKYECMNAVLLEKMPLAEFYGEIVAESLNDISRACGIDFGDIKDIEIQDNTRNKEIMGLLCDAVITIIFNDPSSRLSVTVHRSNSSKVMLDPTKSYIVHGSANGVSFNIEIMCDASEGVYTDKNLDFNLSISKGGYTYKIKSSKDKTHFLASQNKQDGCVAANYSYDKCTKIRCEEVATEISEFVQSPSFKYIKVAGIASTHTIAAGHRQGHGTRSFNIK